MARTVDVEPDLPVADSDEYASSDDDSDFDVPKHKPKPKKAVEPVTQKNGSQYATATTNTNTTVTGYHTPAEMDGGANNDNEWSTVGKKSAAPRRFNMASSGATSSRGGASSYNTGGLSTPNTGTNGSRAPSKNSWAKVKKVRANAPAENPWEDEFSGYAPGGNVNVFRKVKPKKNESDEEDF